MPGTKLSNETYQEKESVGEFCGCITIAFAPSASLENRLNASSPLLRADEEHSVLVQIADHSAVVGLFAIREAIEHSIL